jgi:uncharacterized protein
MSMKIQETFAVQAPVARVWEFLIDPQQVVQCLPGAELTEVEDERTFRGRIRVKVGPVTASYKGKAHLEDLNEAEHRVRMVGEGKETAGSGSARMTMNSRLVELPGGGTEVHVEASVDVVGRIVQFGRGLMEEVSRQLFRQFSACVQVRLAEEPAEAAASSASDGATEDQPAAAADGAPQADTSASATSATLPPTPEAAMAAAGSGLPPRPAPVAAKPPPTGQSRQPQPQQANQPVRALPLLFRAIWAMIKRFFGKLFGR